MSRGHVATPRLRGVVFIVLATCVLGGCGPPTMRRSPAYTPEALMLAARSRAPTASPEELVVPYRVSSELVTRAFRITRPARSDYEKARYLSNAITSPDGFGLEYEAVATSTALETVERGRGNCLSLISLFIGLAREVGLEAYYVDASDRVNDIRKEEEIIVDSGHIAAAARSEQGWTLVDYDGHVSDYRTFKVIDDVTALAHYYNNLGYELLQEATRAGRDTPWETVRRNFEIATLVSPGFARAHNNLGVVYAKQGRSGAAERNYLAAIASDPRFDAPYHNLGNLQFERGDIDGAIEAYDKAIEIRRRNPYVHHHRGLALYQAGDYVEAARAFEEAISLKEDYVDPYNVLAQVYVHLGRHADAERIRQLAIKRAARGGQ